MHPDNPCQYEDNQAVAAKTWELLRRNEQFRADADRYVKFWQDGERENRDAAWSFIDKLEDEHPFAAAAIRWMVPEPYFTRRLRERVDGTDEDGKPAKWDLVWRGFTPQMPALTDAGWEVDDDKPSSRGHPCRLGPELGWCEGDKVDEIMEWGDFQARVSNRSLAFYDLPWRELPNPLQRAFQFHWRGFLFGQPNPFTGKNDRKPPHIVDFGPRIRREMMQADEVTRLALLLNLQDYSDNYIVFAFPKGKILSKSEIADTLKLWEKEIEDANEVQSRNAELFGTRDEWEYFLHSQERGLEKAHFQIYKEKGHDEAAAFERFHRDRKHYQAYVDTIKNLISRAYPHLSAPD